MRTDQIAPRVPLTQANSAQDKKWSVFRTAIGGLLASFVAGLFAESAFHSYQAGMGARQWWRTVVSAVCWFGIAIIGVARGLNKSHTPPPATFLR